MIFEAPFAKRLKEPPTQAEPPMALFEALVKVGTGLTLTVVVYFAAQPVPEPLTTVTVYTSAPNVDTDETVAAEVRAPPLILAPAQE